MITREEIELLLTDELRRAMDANIDREPAAVALDRSVPHSRLVASQVKYLQRARTKLPSYYAARCIIPSLAFEQASGEASASGKRYSGALCVDLTCGLGVDSFYLSRRFERVVAVERDLSLAHLARVNFRLLGAHNIEVVNMQAEEFIAAQRDINPDLIYIDPDRRTTLGRRAVVLSDCSPDVTELLPALRAMAPRVVVKLSPLFDVDEVFRLFGERTRVEVVSVGGECKEVVAECGEGVDGPVVAANVAGWGVREFARGGQGARAHHSFGEPDPPPHQPLGGEGHTQDDIHRFRYLVVPDVAFAKARVARDFFAAQGVVMESDSSYGFAVSQPVDIPGKCYGIERIFAYNPKRLRPMLRVEGIERLEILKRAFPHTPAEIARQLGVGEGGARKAAFTRFGGALWCILLF